MFGSDEANKQVKPNSRRRVLKPPGGGSSDIFGTSADTAEPQRKTKTNHLTSSIFGGETVNTSRNKSGNNSFYNLFGNSKDEVKPFSAPVNQTRSNIILGDHVTKYIEDEKNSLNLLEEVKSHETNDSLDSVEQISNSVQGVGSMSMFTDPVIPEPKSDSMAVNEPSENSDDKPVQVEKAQPVVNGTASAPPSVAAPSSVAAAPVTASAPPSKQRVPPGGFSSGLW